MAEPRPALICTALKIGWMFSACIACMSTHMLCAKTLQNTSKLGMKKSAVVAHALERDREYRHELLMREGYEEIAEYDAKLLKEFEHVDNEMPVPEYAEK